ncbi:MAG: lytic murein transglycosylase B [Gallionellales bacterium GWA2_60_18]|nr:MAG: lytic murein transglycosylase B [Gallionellales bacterium GWA2_60_18]
MRPVLFLLLLIPLAVHAADLPGIPGFIDEMVAKHRFKRDELETVFARAQHRPDVIEAISRPATIKPWVEYRAAFVNPQRVRLGLEFWHKYRKTLRRAEKQYGVPQEIIVALIGVETIYGRNAGSYRVLDALTTLAFDYPRRAVFFRSELENYLLLAREQQFDLLATRGSYAGAMGIPQFMPGSYRNYAVDFNHNGKVDLMREDRDAIGSVANYLQGYGWVRGAPVAARAQVSNEACPGAIGAGRTLAGWAVDGILPEGKYPPEMEARLLDFTVEDGKEFWLAFENFKVITLYNNSDFYAMSVLQLAEELKAARR